MRRGRYTMTDRTALPPKWRTVPRDTMDATDASDRLWDAREVARYLNVSRSWVYQHAEAGTLPYFRVGALLRFDPDAIRALGQRGGK
jgi:excisionase family DNA binding protein